MEIEVYYAFLAEDSQLDAVRGRKQEPMGEYRRQPMLGFTYHRVLQQKKKEKERKMLVERATSERQMQTHLKAYN